MQHFSHLKRAYPIFIAFKYTIRILAMPLLLVGSAAFPLGVWLHLFSESGQLPLTCDFVGALKISIVPAVISALIFITIVEVRNYSRWKLLGCLFVVVALWVSSELSTDILIHETSTKSGISACESKSLISVLSVWMALLVLSSIWKAKSS